MTGDRSVNDNEVELPSRPLHDRVVSTSSSQSVVTEDDESALTIDVALVSPANSANNSVAASSVQVAVRVRPLLSSLESGCGSCIHILPSLLGDPTTIQIGPESGPTFTFDEVFPSTTSQVHVFENRVAPLVERCLEGYNATILAYGQTGSGKTHTVIGPSACHSTPDDESSGMIPRAVSSLFHQLRRKKIEMVKKQPSSPQKQQLSPDRLNGSPSVAGTTPKGSKFAKDINDGVAYEFQVRVQFLELYGEEIRDLLTTSASTNSSGSKLTIRDIGNDEPEVVGATSQVVASAEEALRCLTLGMLRRVTASTAMNESSSRSHAIFSILMEQTSTTDTTADVTAVGLQVRRSKFNFVDLAGSERQKRTRAEGQRLKEGIDINKGLLVLGNVISALGDPKKRGKAFVPYRDSKLTRLLKGSLGGNHKTLMIACVSPSSTNMEESLNCLRYANRAKNIQNHAVVNMDARSRMITELKAQVQALAKDLLRAKESGDPRGGAFTHEALVTLATGGSAKAMAPAEKTALTVTPMIKRTSAAEQARILSPESGAVTENSHRQRQIDAEEALKHTRNQLKRCRRESLIIAEQLHVTKGEKEIYRLIIEALGDNGNFGASSVAPQLLPVDQLFVNRAAEYEKEISRLKDELRVVRCQVEDKREHADVSPIDFIEKANQAVKAEWESLAHIQTELLSLQKSPTGSEPISIGATPRGELDTSTEDIETEARAEEEHLAALTLKYSRMEEEDQMTVLDGLSTPRESENADLPPTAKAAEHRRFQIEADLLEISRVIESKEELISQLQCSQAKYSSMKEFYEGKLFEMELLLDQKEEERQKIIVELERLKENNHDTRDLEEQLKKKEEHIAGIRKQKLQLKDLTAVSSKNAAEIDKLQNDVKTMKEKKVSMQKQLMEERKAHAVEIRILKKEVIQKDRETRKWQQISKKKTSEAERSSHVAKMKVQQLGQLRAKYKDAEKTIRMLQIKKGVMAKAGLDPVIVGRRGVVNRNQSRNPADDDRAVDADSLRDYFDRRVADVGRKEALADKLARGWEEHMQLTLQRTELEGQDSESSKEEIQALDLRIQYEEDRIRKLAYKLGKKQSFGSSDEAEKSSHSNAILYGKEFQKICNGASPQGASEIATKVLFGMVVRERRRIASLAKTASSLDEKLQACLLDNEAKEVAFRSYVQDSQQDFANISMNHQEQILSLMSLVKGDNDNSDSSNSAASDVQGESKSAGTTESSKLLVLANERISVLEQQLRELKTEKKVSESYRLEKDEAKEALSVKEEEYAKLEVWLAGLRATLRRVRDHLTDSKGEEKTSASNLPDVVVSCLDIIREALRDSPAPLSPKARRHSCPMNFHPSTFSPNSQKQWDYIQNADDGEDDAAEETPEWADEIMADLALIAEGQLPPSLKSLPDWLDISDEKLAEHVKSPPRPTGIQKPRAASSGSPKDQVAKQGPRSEAEDDNLDNSDNSLSPESLGTVACTKESPGTATNSGKQGCLTPSSSSLKSQASATSKGPRREIQGSVLAATEDDYAKAEALLARLDRTADRMLDELLESNCELFAKPPSDFLFARQADPSVKAATSEAARKVKEYTQQNVFERLQKTTTQSFAGKHPPTQPPIHEQPQFMNDAHSSHGSVGPKGETMRGARSSLDGKAKRMVTHTTNEAHPADANLKTGTHKSPSRPKYKSRFVKSPQKPANSRNTTPTRGKSPARQRKEEYTQQDVFERLTKTTTEAYAVKKRFIKN